MPGRSSSRPTTPISPRRRARLGDAAPRVTRDRRPSGTTTAGRSGSRRRAWTRTESRSTSSRSTSARTSPSIARGSRRSRSRTSDAGLLVSMHGAGHLPAALRARPALGLARAARGAGRGRRVRRRAGGEVRRRAGRPLGRLRAAPALRPPLPLLLHARRRSGEAAELQGYRLEPVAPGTCASSRTRSSTAGAVLAAPLCGVQGAPHGRRAPRRLRDPERVNITVERA